MGPDQRPVPRFEAPGPSSSRFQGDAQRLFLAAPYRRSLEGSPEGSVRPLVHRVRPLPQVAFGRHVGPGARTLGSSIGPGGPNRLGPVARRRDEHPGVAGGGGSREKGGSGEPSDHALGRSRGGYGSKLHLVSSGNAAPLGAAVTAGQESEATHLPDTLEGVILPYAWTTIRYRPGKLAGDKAYNSWWIREDLIGLGIKPVIPHYSNQPTQPKEPGFDRRAYRKRNAIERLVGWLKECRRVATRFEKLATSYLTMVKLAMIHRLLKTEFSYGT